MGADPWFGAVMDGTDLRSTVFRLRMCAPPNSPLVRAHRAGTIDLVLRQAGADHVQAVEPGLGGDCGVIAPAGEDTPSSIDQVKCFAILYFPITLPTLSPILAAPVRRRVSRRVARGDGLKQGSVASGVQPACGPGPRPEGDCGTP